MPSRPPGASRCFFRVRFVGGVMSSAIELIVEGYARLVGRANLQLHEVVALSRRSAFSKEARTRL